LANPNWTWKVNLADSDASPSWLTLDLANDKFVFGYNASDADSPTLGAVVLPDTGTKWAEQLWVYDASEPTNKYKKVKAYKTPDSATQRQKVISITNDAACASTPWFTAYNATDRNLSAPFTGTTSFAYPLLKAYHATAGAPAQYWGQATDTAMKQLVVAGGNNPNGLVADTNYVPFDDATAKERLFTVSMVVPSDLATGTVNWRFSVRYTYV